MDTTRKTRIGIIGLGKMGQTRARELVKRDDVELVCGFDPSPDTFIAAHSNVDILQSPEAVVACDVDAVFVCTPNKFTPGSVIAALEAGKHVFCEKPPGRTVADIEKIIECEQRHPELRLQFGFNHRYHGGILEAKRVVDSGRLGRILWLRGIYGKSGGEGFEKEWRNSKDIVGAGILLDQGIHMLDLFRFFCGDFVEVKSMVTTAHWPIDVEDNAFALLRDRIGRIAMLHSSSTQWKHRFNLEIYLDEGYVSVNGILTSTRSYGDETVTIARRNFGSGPTGNPREEVTYFDSDPSWEREIDEFLDHVRTGSPVTSGTSEQALKAMKLVYAIYRGDETFMASDAAPAQE